LEGQQQHNDGKISKILVAIDGSVHSMKAADMALELTKIELVKPQKVGSELTALTVLDVSRPRKFLSSFIAAPTYGLRELEEERNAAKQRMEVIRRKAEDRKIPFKAEIIEGLASAEASIIDYSKSHEMDFIVVGTKGRTGFSKVLLGSVASRVVEYAHCSVIVVK
jgi:nucleotide-binding universal stress UspA family protein